jgi:D-alanyl-D-alanine carboxypeptidase (penicillin-binding protein 5/6)
LLLQKPGYTGLKTGITDAAGPCCSVSYQKEGYGFIFVLLNSNTMESRWEEVPILLNWVINKPQNN